LAARTRNLRKVYGRTVAVDHVDLDVPVGSVLLGVVAPTVGRPEQVGTQAIGRWRT
jgi:hypothetical protein